LERDKKLTEGVIDYCEKVGVDVVGFANPELYNRFQEQNRPQTFLKDVKTVIIIGFHLYDLMLDAWNYYRDQKRSYQFADSIVENFGNRVKRFLTKKGYESIVISYAPGLFLKDSAALAGMGPIGKNNLLITPNFGSQVRLRAIVTTAPLVCGEPILESDYCKDCDRCIKACPANAFIDEKYTKKICDDWARANWEVLSPHTVIWCNVCIEACPYTKKPA
jgi:epoxyqueuosine reductase QueG